LTLSVHEFPITDFYGFHSAASRLGFGAVIMGFFGLWQRTVTTAAGRTRPRRPEADIPGAR
jgi:hypothetical protein